MRSIWSLRFLFLLILLGTTVTWIVVARAQQPIGAAATSVKLPPTTTRPPFGIAVKRPVFAGACKACPWGVLAGVTAQALKPSGYDVQICWVCWSSYGPREMADKTMPVLPANAWDEPNGVTEYAEMPPQAVPDISATSLSNLLDAWNGTGAYRQDRKKRQNYRVIAAVQQPNYLAIAVNKKSGITDLAQIKTRTQPTWIAGNSAVVLEFYGISEELLKTHGGGFIRTTDRLKRASADVFIGNAQLAYTPEQRMWYEVSQLDDLQFLDIPPALIEKALATQTDYHRGTMPLASLRGVDRPIATVMRQAHVIYVRDDAPDQFAYDVAKALYEHQDLFRLSGDPYYYDIRLVAVSSPIPMHPGALKYYRERGYIK